MTLEHLSLSDDRFARDLDRTDPLARFRDRFYISDTIYMDGNSLGLLSRDAERSVMGAVQDWKRLGISGWLDADPPWYYLAERLGEDMAILVGAEPDEVTTAASTTVNLHALAATFYRPRPGRYRILADELNFPSDIYALRGQAALHGLDPEDAVVLVRSPNGLEISEDDVIRAMTDDVAMALLPGVLYRSGQLLDMERLTAAARERGIPIGFDLSHSIGSVPHRLSEWGPDFAFWCTYKHLNGGPGSVAGLYVNRRHHQTGPTLAGWWGSDKDVQFRLELDFTPAASAGAWQIGTACILGMAALRGSLDIFSAAGIDAVRSKSLKLTDYLISLVSGPLSRHGFGVGTPLDHSRRGGHVAVTHPDARRIADALRHRGVIPDFRPPDVVRLAPVALYSSYRDVWEVARRLELIMDQGEYEQFSSSREVT